MGGTAGSQIGGNTAVSIIGAVIGDLAGAATERMLTRTTAKEFIVEQEVGQRFVVVQADEEDLKADDPVMILTSGSIRITRDTRARWFCLCDVT